MTAVVATDIGLGVPLTLGTLVVLLLVGAVAFWRHYRVHRNALQALVAAGEDIIALVARRDPYLAQQLGPVIGSATAERGPTVKRLVDTVHAGVKAARVTDGRDTRALIADAIRAHRERPGAS